MLAGVDNLAYGRTVLAARVAERRKRWLEEADRIWKERNGELLFALGIGLYWGEGSKRSSRGSSVLSLCNTDPGLLRVWLKWCRTYLPGLGLSFLVQIHSNVREKEAEVFWRSALGFEEPLQISVNRPSSSKGRRAKTRPLLHGVLRITVRRGASEWHHKMLRFLELSMQI